MYGNIRVPPPPLPPPTWDAAHVWQIGNCSQFEKIQRMALHYVQKSQVLQV